MNSLTNDILKEYPVSIENILDTLDSIYDKILGDYENKANYKKSILKF